MGDPPVFNELLSAHRYNCQEIISLNGKSSCFNLY